MLKVPVINEQLDTLNQHLRHQNALLEVMAADKMTDLATNLHEVAQLVADGLARELLAPGDKINLEWNDLENGAQKNTYVAPWNVCHFEDAELAGGETAPVMDMEWHYTTPFGVPFDETEAFFESETDLPAGTYCFTVRNNVWLASENGKVYHFTTTETLPAGAQLRRNAAYNATWNNSTLSAYASAYHRTKLWDVTLTEGAAGTNLGETDGTGDLNHFHRLNLGYNRWAKSCLRSWLNSRAKCNTEGQAGGWYEKTGKWDVMPAVALTKDGFLCGLADDVIDCMLVTKICTARNTVTDDGGTDETFDRVFLKSLEQWYMNPQAKGVEGDYWEYWKQTLGAASPLATSKTYPLAKVYALNGKTSAQNCFQRSASRGYGHNVWSANTSGSVMNAYASNSYRCQPACRIGKNPTI